MSDSRSATQKYLPAMATTSLRAVLDTFRATPRDEGGYDYLITKLNAYGSEGDKEDPDKVDKELGIKAWLSATGAKLQVRYQCQFDEEGNPTNPLNERAIGKLQDVLDSTGLADASVSEVRVKFRDPELGDDGLEEWHMTLHSNFVHGEQDRQELKKHPESMALIEQEGFKYMTLNMRNIIDRRQELNEPKAKQRPQLVWNGDTFGGLRNDLGVTECRQIVNKHLGEFGFGKRYGPGEEDSIVLLGVDSPGDEEAEA